MKKSKKCGVCRIIALLLGALLLSGCQKSGKDEIVTSGQTETQAPPADSNEQPGVDYTQKTWYPGEIADAFKTYGRVFAVGKALACDWTASGIEFSAYCTGDVSVTLYSSDETYLTVYVDGVRIDETAFDHDTHARTGKTFLAGAGIGTVCIAEGLEQGLHTFRILKQADVRICEQTSIQSITLSGELADRPEDAEIYLEFLGDSITCGYACLGINGVDERNAATTDGTSAYSYLTAQALGADFSMVAVSGIGIYKGTSTSLPVMEDVFLCNSYFRSHAEADYHPVRVPDAVVINLGTNDEGRIGSNEDAFSKKVKSLIETVRNTYQQQVPIVFCYHSMKTGTIAPDLITAVIREMGGAEAGLYSVVMTTDISPTKPANSHNGAPGNHPDAEQHRRQAQTLTSFLQSILNGAD